MTCMNRKEAEILFPKLALLGKPTQRLWGGPILRTVVTANSYCYGSH